MKWMGTVLGSLIVLIGIILSPWPQFITDIANSIILAIPEAADDFVFQNIVKVFAAVVAFVIFPGFGGIAGYIIMYILERKLD
ncbi:hypothetical protein ACFLUU_04115 [Chloroflexota bacterium]